MNRSCRFFLLATTVLASLVFAIPASAAPTFTLTEPVEGQRINGNVSINGYAPVGTTLTSATCAISNSSYSTPFSCLYMTRWISIGHIVNGGEGYKTITVVVSDATGSTTITRNVYNDLTDPNTFVTSGPNGTTITGSSATWEFSASETSSFECSLDGAAFTACTSPYTASGLSDATHEFRVRAIDLAGRVDQSPATRSVTVYNGPPLATFGEGPNEVTNNTSPGINVLRNRPDALAECRVDSGEWTDCSDGGYEMSELSDGDHTAEARAYLPGPTQVQATPATYSFTVDTVAPTLSLVSPKLYFGGLSASFELSTTATDINYVSCSVAGDSDWDCGLSYTRNFGPWEAAGEHYAEWTATDNAGNQGPTLTWDWTQFPDPPQTAIATKPDPTTAVQVASFTFTSETATEFECGVDGAAFAACPASHSITGLGAGPHVLQVRAKDPAGQVDDTPSSAVFTLSAPPVTVMPIPPKPKADSLSLAKKVLTLKVTGASSVKATVETCAKKKVKGKKKTVCKSAAKGTAMVSADGAVTVKLSKKLKKKISYKVTIVVTGADGQATTVVKKMKLK